MPAWWGRKSSKNKEQQQQVVTEQNPLSNQLNPSNSSIKADKKKGKHKPKSLEDVLSRNSPRTSKDFGGAAASGLSCCDSDNGEKIGHPLPRPSISSGNDHIQGVVFGLGSGSGSVSSLSSSVSSEDHPVAQDQGQFGNFRGHGDTMFNMRSRSPGPGSRGPTSPTSTLLSRHGLSLESPTGKQEDGKSQCHRLPLPPGSPTSPSALPNTRTCVVENTTTTQSKWKKGRLLGRGTFGHVYLGFNR